MNNLNHLLESIIEYDLNPIIVFDKNGKIVKYNQEAEYLLSFTSKNEIFDLGVKYAPINYGFKKNFISLEFNRVKYYAILVGYEDDEFLAVKLYKEGYLNKSSNKKEALAKSSIFTLLELSSNSVIDTSEVEIIKNYDPSIPEIFLNVKNFLKILNLLFKEFSIFTKIYITLKIKVAQNIKIGKKRYPVGLLCFEAKDTQKELFLEEEKLQEFLKNSDIVFFVEKNKVILEFPIITSLDIS